MFGKKGKKATTLFFIFTEKSATSAESCIGKIYNNMMWRCDKYPKRKSHTQKVKLQLAAI